MLRPSFVPPAQIRQLRDYTRLRTDLTRERTRHWQRLEKLLEDALIKVSSVASKLTTQSARDMIEALIAGQRDPPVLASLARGRVKASTAGKTGHGNPYLRGILGEAAAAAARTDTFLGERYRRIIKRRGKLRALVAIARTILVIIWHLLATPHARYRDLGASYHATRTD